VWPPSLSSARYPPALHAALPISGRGPLRDCAADPAPRGAAAGGARTRPWGSSSPRSRGASPGAGVGATGDPYAPHAEGPRLEVRSEEHTSELQSRFELVCRLLLE